MIVRDIVKSIIKELEVRNRTCLESYDKLMEAVLQEAFEVK